LKNGCHLGGSCGIFGIFPHCCRSLWQALPSPTTIAPSYVSVARMGIGLARPKRRRWKHLTNSPDDLQARQILGFYFRGPARSIYGPAAAIVSRRNHVLWLVSHHPSSELAALSETTIDMAGHSLADKEGYDQLGPVGSRSDAMEPMSAFHETPPSSSSCPTKPIPFLY
jgi:hypothetical protein